MRSSLSSWLGCSSLAVIAQTPRAQQVRGVVRDSTAGIPLAGAVVVILDSARVASGRAIADAAGRFRVRRGDRARSAFASTASGTAHARCRFRRDKAISHSTLRWCGSRRCSTPFASRTASFAPGQPIAAPRFSCGSRFDGNFSRRSSRMTKAPRMAHALTFRRRVTPTDRVIQTQTNRTAGAGVRIRPFVAAASAATFATEGYIEEDVRRTHLSRARLGSAPRRIIRRNALLSPAGRGMPRTPEKSVLAFTPPTRSPHDRRRERRHLDRRRDSSSFAHSTFYIPSLNPPRCGRKPADTWCSATAPNGVSFIEQWIMRLPVLTAPSSPSPQPHRHRARRQDRRDLRVSEIEETGGRMLDATWDDRTTWSAKPTGLAGIAVESRSQSPIAGAIVALDGTSDTAVANARGAYALTRAIPGRYSATISDTSLAPFASPRRVRQIVRRCCWHDRATCPAADVRGRNRGRRVQGAQTSRDTSDRRRPSAGAERRDDSAPFTRRSVGSKRGRRHNHEDRYRYPRPFSRVRCAR